MKYLLTMPRGPVTSKISSHKGAQGWMYYAMCKEAQLDVTMYDNSQNYNDYDGLILYHGNDWFGSLNLFGGMTKDNAIGFYNLSKFKGEVISLGMECPDYHNHIIKRIGSKAKRDKLWEQIDLDNLESIHKNSKTIEYPNINVAKHFIAGDSHAISLYRPNNVINSVPYTTLNGALKKGLETFLPDNFDEFDSLGFYFGAIDLRHHLIRLNECPIKLAHRYLEACKDIQNEYNIPIDIYVPLPIEHEDRKIPKSGYYKGKPFWGSWEERKKCRDKFIKELNDKCENINIVNWTEYLEDVDGSLLFDKMEKPQSVHLSREFYPYWNGIEKEEESIDSFFD